MDFTVLPSLNAVLNSISAVFITMGYVFIRAGKKEAHRRCMLTAITTSSLFLISYVVYHYTAGATAFGGVGWIRYVYFVILGTHTVLAIAVLPLVIITLLRALSGRYSLHKSIARWTFPVWLYVSVTGVTIYFMLYHLYPPAL
jgi:putative membrane protein